MAAGPDNPEGPVRGYKHDGGKRGAMNPHAHHMVLAGLALLVGIAPAAAAYDAGTIVDKQDYDYTPVPSDKSGKVSLCGVDMDGDGAYDASEPLYLDTNSTTCYGGVAAKDVRLLPYGDAGAGTEVDGFDEDHRLPLVGPVAHEVKFFDANGAGEFEAPSTLYLDLFQVASNRVDVGDVRLTAYQGLPAFSAVRSGDPDVSMALADIAAGGKALTDASTTYKAGSGYYVNTDGGALGSGVSDNHVRLTDKANPLPVPDPETPAFTVTGVVPGQKEVAPGLPFQVHVTVRNEGDGAGAAMVETTLDGVLVDARGTPTVAPGNNATVVVTLVAPLQEGDVDIGSGGASATVAVAGPGFGFSAIVAADPVVQHESGPRTFGREPAMSAAGSAAGEAPGAGMVWAVGLMGVMAVAMRRTARP